MPNKNKEIRRMESGPGHGSSDRRLQTMLAAFLMLGLFLAATACGKKAPPFLPQKTFGAKVGGVTAESQDGCIVLKGRVQRLNSVPDPETPISGCRVYYAFFPVEKRPCAGCPIEFREYREFGPEIVTPEGFLCKIPDIRSGSIYYFKILLVGPDASLGPVSERISIEIR